MQKLKAKRFTIIGRESRVIIIAQILLQAEMKSLHICKKKLTFAALFSIPCDGKLRSRVLILSNTKN